MPRLLDRIDSPRDLKRFPLSDLPKLCEEIRAEIIQTCARTGGHLGSSLGAVELNIALHYVLDSPTDRLVWDVGHQAYAHKLVTGRRARFSTLRTEGGLAGFPERAESEHDAFGVGHASTAVSAALGMVEGRRLSGDSGKVVALVGDGALTGGMAFEGLNQAGYLKSDILVVLNDNEMSISPNVGAVSEWLSKRLASPSAARLKQIVKTVLHDAPHGQETIDALRRGLDAAKALFTPGGMLFEALGFEYVGPVDGHDVAGLVGTLRRLAVLRGPVLLHALTTKGKGYPPAEADAATRGHALSFFDPKTGRSASRGGGSPPYTDVFADALCAEMERDPRVVAITAAMLEGTGLARCKQRFPGRTYDVGIAEPHAVTFAAGLACEGLRPVVAIYSTFLQRAFDQIVHDVALQRLPVTFALDRGGLVGADGKTHQGAFDVGYLRSVPGLVVMAPSDENELRHMLRTAIELPGPAALRFPRRASAGVPAEPPHALEVGRARWLRSGGAHPDVVIAAAGTPARDALAAATALADEGIVAAVLDARFVKPLDAEVLCTAVSAAGRLVTVEESALAGGFGAACLEALADRGALGGVQVSRLGLPDAFVPHGDAGRQLAELGIDAAGIAAAARALVGVAPPDAPHLATPDARSRAAG